MATLSKAPSSRVLVGWIATFAITTATITLVEALTRSDVEVPYPGALYLLCIVVSAFVGGGATALISAAGLVAYVTYAGSIPGHPFHYTSHNAWRLFVLLVTSSVATVLLGVLWRRVERSGAERERMELERVEAADEARRKDRFLATVSHELRGPLSTMIVWEEILRTSSDEPTKARAMAVLRESVEQQSKLISDLLDVARSTGDKLRIEQAPLDLAALASSAVRAARPHAVQKELSLTISVADDVPRISGDETRVQQIFANLLSNALKFTEPGGKIEIFVTASGGGARVEIRDTGEGIDPAFFTRLFQPFQQADESITRKHEGLGLGLAISKQLAEQHGGTISAYSDGKGKGARFVVWLPAISA